MYTHLDALFGGAGCKKQSQLVLHACQVQLAMFIFAVEGGLLTAAIVDSHAAQAQACRGTGGHAGLFNGSLLLCWRRCVGVGPGAHFQVQHARSLKARKGGREEARAAETKGASRQERGPHLFLSLANSILLCHVF